MNNSIRKMLIGMATLFLMLPVAATAHDDGVCERQAEATDHIYYVETAIDAATYATSKGKPPGSEPVDESRLLAKAAVAKAYVAEHKYADASSKLEGIVAKVTSMLEDEKKKKIPYGGEEIIRTSMDAIYCVVDLSQS